MEKTVQSASSRFHSSFGRICPPCFMSVVGLVSSLVQGLLSSLMTGCLFPPRDDPLSVSSFPLFVPLGSFLTLSFSLNPASVNQSSNNSVPVSKGQ